MAALTDGTTTAQKTTRGRACAKRSMGVAAGGGRGEISFLKKPVRSHFAQRGGNWYLLLLKGSGGRRFSSPQLAGVEGDLLLLLLGEIQRRG